MLLGAQGLSCSVRCCCTNFYLKAVLIYKLLKKCSSNTLAKLNSLPSALLLPLVAVMDADPHGISIMAAYRLKERIAFSLEMTVLCCIETGGDRLATPQMPWIGIHSTDIENLHLPVESRISLTVRDRSLINSLMKRPIHFIFAMAMPSRIESS